MSTNIKIEDLFEKDIKRSINGVIKADQYDDENVYTELDEYVVTQESLKHFDDFFEIYLSATQIPTDKIGVWVSGFFGSGKSHFIKILSYLLENKTVYGKSALEFFEDKIHDPHLFGTIEKSVKYGTKDVILFNVDSKAKHSKERIVDVLLRAFNEKRGFFGRNFWIADFEEDMQNRGIYDAFKDEFKKTAGQQWEEVRGSYAFKQDSIIEALSICGYQSRDSSRTMLDSFSKDYPLNVETFTKRIEKYCKSKGDDHQVIFLIDEIGQYIGEDSELMLNLQTTEEELGTILRGKAWLIVTSQADIDSVTKEMVKGNDFSKIQARFDTRLSMSSSNVDEVIKKRILLKKEQYKDMLASIYAGKKTILKNLISFSKGSAEMKNYKEEWDFTEVYPFVPYQINLLQKVFDKIRQTGSTGKHLAKGERSMLNAFKEATEVYGECDVGVLIPFHLFYNTIENFLDPIIVRTIKQAEENDQLEDHDCEILKILFMIRHVKEIQPNLDNLVVLSISSLDEDKLKLREKVTKSLQRLEKQTLINKSNDTFYFLTNEEQEINREIKNIDIEKHLMLDEIYNVIYNSNDICPDRYMDRKFNRSVDEKVKTLSDADLSIKFLTPRSDEIMRGSGQRSLDGENLSNIDSTDSLLFIFPGDSKFVDQITKRLQIDKYLKQNSLNRNDSEIQSILLTKRQEMEKLKESSVLAIYDGARDARIFIDGKEVTSIDKKNPKDRVKEGFVVLVQNVYSKSGYVTKDYESDTEILRILRSDDLEKFGVGKSETNKLALDEMLNYISIRNEKNSTVVLKDMKEHFMRKPYGWKDLTVSGLVATLFIGEDVKLRYQKTYLVSNAEEIAKYITRKEDADKIIIEMRKKTGFEIINAVKSILRDEFDKTDIPEKENDLYSFSHNLLEEESIRVKEISGKYAEGKYPGKEIIESYAGFLKTLLDVTDPSSFLRKMSEEKDELIGQRHTVEPVMSFFGSVQIDIFRRVSKEVDNFKRNVQFLSEDARSDVAGIEDILSSDEPYSRIKDLTQLEIRIKTSLEDSLSNLKLELHEKLKFAMENIERELAGYSGFSDVFKRSVMQPFNDIERLVAESDDCTYVKLQIVNIDELSGSAYEKIEYEKRLIREIVDLGSGEDGADRIDVTPVVFIKGTSLFRTIKDIESKEDLDAYLEKLRAVMQRHLDDNNKIKVL